MEQVTNNRKRYISQAKAIILWSRGLQYEPEIYSLGNTDEETEQIRRSLEAMLEKGQTR